MKLSATQPAPLFIAEDYKGNKIDLESYRGRPVLLCFHRFVGCPVCNLRFHQLESEATYFKSKNLALISIFESSTEHIKKYAQGDSFYSTLIGDKEERIYGIYGVERSMGKVFKGMFKGGAGKAMRGIKLFKQRVSIDGPLDRISADFLIDNNGILLASYYSKHMGDNLPVATIKSLMD